MAPAITPNSSLPSPSRLTLSVPIVPQMPAPPAFPPQGGPQPALWDTGDYFMLFAAVKLLCDSGHRCGEPDFWSMVHRTLESSAMSSRRLLDTPHQNLVSGFLSVITLVSQDATLDTVTESQIEVCSRALTYKRMHEVAAAYNKMSQEQYESMLNTSLLNPVPQSLTPALNSLSVDVNAAKNAVASSLAVPALISPPNSTTLSGTMIGDDNFKRSSNTHTFSSVSTPTKTKTAGTRRKRHSSSPSSYPATEDTSGSQATDISALSPLRAQRAAGPWNVKRSTQSPRHSSSHAAPPQPGAHVLKIDYSVEPHGRLPATVIKVPKKRRAASFTAAETPSLIDVSTTPRARGVSLGAKNSPDSILAFFHGPGDQHSAARQTAEKSASTTPAIEVLRQSPIRRLILYNSDISCAPSPKLTLTVPASPLASPQKPQTSPKAILPSQSPVQQQQQQEPQQPSQDEPQKMPQKYNRKSQSPGVRSRARTRARTPQSPSDARHSNSISRLRLLSLVDEIEATGPANTIAAALRMPQYREKCKVYKNFDTIRHEIENGVVTNQSQLQVNLLLMSTNYSIVDSQNAQVASAFCAIIDRVITDP